MSSNHYINNQELYEEVVKAKKKQEDNPDLMPAECYSPRLIEMFQQLVDNMGRHRYYYRYSFLEDMKNKAMMVLIENAFKFDHVTRDNPFSYYTSCVKNAFSNYMNLESKESSISDEIRMMNGLQPSSNRQINHELSMMSEELDGTKRVLGTKKRRGRKPKALKAIIDDLDERIKNEERNLIEK